MKIQIPKPCHEDLNTMSPAERGLFCGSCQKVVIDFSSMTDAEIVDYFKKIGSQKTCGLFSTTQVNRTLQPQKEKTETPRRRFFFKELAAASVAFFITSTTAKSQNDTTQVEYNQKIETDSLESIAPPFAINGKVVNGNEVLSEAIISIKGTEHKTTSLENGIFSFLIPQDTLQQQDSIILVAEYEGLEAKEFEISASIHQSILINFEKEKELPLEKINEKQEEKKSRYGLSRFNEEGKRIIYYIETPITREEDAIYIQIYGNVMPKSEFPVNKLVNYVSWFLNPIKKEIFPVNIKTQDTNNQSKTALIPHISKWYTRGRLYQSLKDLMRRTFV
ncbi:hypothetical protein V9L05_14180 [Bernardetia sp. Wsw4-3y2]|uniref:hypothetical protein n=1 Tax=Bernardetia sp. Wsw4-3y2 TaxID=3127471 RepID=UPI0030CCB60B